MHIAAIWPNLLQIAIHMLRGSDRDALSLDKAEHDMSLYSLI